MRLILNNFIHLLHTATGFFHANNIRKIIGQTNNGFGLHVDPRPSWNIIEHNGQWAHFGNSFEMLINSFLRRFVVIRTDAQNAINPRPIGRLDFFHHSGGIVSTTIFKDGHTPCHTLSDKCRDVVAFLLCQARCLARRCQNTQKVGAVCQLIFYESLQCIIVDPPFGCEWSDERDT